MRRVDHRRLAAQVCALWLCAVAWDAIYSVYPLTLATGAVVELMIPVLAFLSVLAIGVNVPGAIALLTVWQLVSLVLPLYMYNIGGMRALPMQPILIATGVAAFGFGGLRYRRDVSVVRQLTSLLVAPFLMLAAWLPVPLLASVWQVGLNLAVNIILIIVLYGPMSSRDLLELSGTQNFWANTLWQYKMFPTMLLEVCFGFPIIMFLLLLPLMRDLSAWVWARTRS
jgi:hypothetical protein